jgi:hypothetical protein
MKTIFLTVPLFFFIVTGCQQKSPVGIDGNNNDNNQVAITEKGDINIKKPDSATLSVPCVNGGGSGGWMYQPGMPEHYFPLGLINVNEWPLRSESKHPMYDPSNQRNKYATCIIVPAKYP